MTNNPEVTDVSSSPPQVSDRMRELVYAVYDAAFNCGNHRVGDSPAYDMKSDRAKEVQAALLREIAALEDKARGLDAILAQFREAPHA